MLPKYSFNELRQHLRLIAITFAIGGIVLYVWTQLLMEMLVQNVFMTGFLVLAVVALLAFALTSAVLLVKIGFIRWKQKFIHGGLTVLALGCSAVSLTLYAFITDTLFGSWIRSMFNLPEGNLFVVGGLVGWTFVFLLAVIAVALTDFKIVHEKLMLVLNAEVALPDRKKSAVEEDQRAPADYDEDETTPFPARAPVQEDAFIGTSVFDPLVNPLYDSTNRG
jgi:hypothetical protein